MSPAHAYQVVCHSCPQRPRSFSSAPRIETSGKVQQQKSVIHGLPDSLRMLRAKSNKSDWLRIRNEFSVHSQKIGPFLRSQFLMLNKRGATSGDDNGCVYEEAAQPSGLGRWCCNAEVQGSRPSPFHERDLFLGSPEFKSSVTLCIANWSASYKLGFLTM